jgi:hypothetical protein
VLFVSAAVIGVGVFGAMVRRAVDVDEVGRPQAVRQFEEIRARVGGPAMLVRDENGRLARHPATPVARDAPITRLYVWSYQAGLGRLVRVDIPFWFYKLKAPAAQLAVRNTGFDLEELGVTPAELERQGPVLLDDETSATTGDLLMIWTE